MLYNDVGNFQQSLHFAMLSKTLIQTLDDVAVLRDAVEKTAVQIKTKSSGNSDEVDKDSYLVICLGDCNKILESLDAIRLKASSSKTSTLLVNSHDDLNGHSEETAPHDSSHSDGESCFSRIFQCILPCFKKRQSNEYDAD